MPPSLYEYHRSVVCLQLCVPNSNNNVYSSASGCLCSCAWLTMTSLFSRRHILLYVRCRRLPGQLPVLGTARKLVLLW